MKKQNNRQVRLVSNEIYCPNCKESQYAERWSTMSAQYPSFQQGDSTCGNTLTVECECLNCRHMFSYDIVNGKVLNLVDIASISNTLDPNVTYLPTVWTIDNKSIRDLEIERLKAQIKSLQDQLLEVQANPDWRQKINI